MTVYQWGCVAPIALMFFAGGLVYAFGAWKGWWML